MIVDRIQREHGLTAMLHLTCVNATQEQLAEVVAQARSLNIKNILALRGDPIAGTNSEFKKNRGRFRVLVSTCHLSQATRRLFHWHGGISRRLMSPARRARKSIGSG